MDKTTYDKYEDNDFTLVAEPVSGISTPSEQTGGQRFSMPAGLPQSVDEALADIDEGELEFDRGETFSHKEVMQMIWSRIGSYGSPTLYGETAKPFKRARLSARNRIQAHNIK